MPSNTNNSLLALGLIPVVMFLYPFRLEAQNINSPYILYTDKEQIFAQSPARQFSPHEQNKDPRGVLFSVNRFFQIEFSIQNMGASYKNHTILWCYLPFSNGYNQITPQVSINNDALLFKDLYGNQFFRFDLKNIPPYSTRILRVDCQILKNPQNVKTSEADIDNPKDFLTTDDLLEVDHPQIRELSRKLIKKNSYQTAKNIFDWVVNNIKYSGYDKQDKGALHGLIYKEGDCTEQAALFTALCRAGNIPSKLIFGYRCDGNCLGTERLHTWSEFYADETWHLADITNKIFDNQNENYIGLENHHNIYPNPFGKNHRYLMDFTYEDVKTRIDIKSVVRLH